MDCPGVDPRPCKDEPGAFFLSSFHSSSTKKTAGRYIPDFDPASALGTLLGQAFATEGWRAGLELDSFRLPFEA